MAWVDARLALFENELKFYAAEFTFGGVTFACIADSQEQIKEMSQTSYIGRRPAKFSVRQADFNAKPIPLRATIQSQGFAFEVFSINFDPVDPMVEIKANMKQ